MDIGLASKILHGEHVEVEPSLLRGHLYDALVARDMHDILGHSLTVITVKAELAGRLMDAGSPAARDEVAQIEQLSRGALADVRATVHGYRGVSISGELAAARPPDRDQRGRDVVAVEEDAAFEQRVQHQQRIF